MEEIDLRDLLELFWSKKVIILICILVAILIGAIYSFNFVEPKYQSSTKIVLSQITDVEDENRNSTSINTSDITLNQKLVDTYTQIITTDSVLSQVIDELGIEDTVASLRKNISVSAVNDTQVLKITVNNKNPETAKDIANQLVKASDVKVREVYKISNIAVLDEAIASSTPYNVNHVKDIAIFAIVGLVIAVGVILFLNMLDNTIGSTKEIENDLGSMVLASIPEYKDPEAKKQKGGKRYEK